MNKTAANFVIVISVIIFMAYMFYYVESGMSWLKYLQIPAIIFGVVMVVLLNIPKIQRSFSGKSSKDSQMLRALFIGADEIILLDAGYRTVIQKMSFVSMPHLLSKVIVTNERVQIRFLPPLSVPSISLFFKDEVDSKSSVRSYLSSNQKILEYKIDEKSVMFKTGHNLGFTIFMNDKKLKALEAIIKNNAPARDASNAQ